MVGQGTVLNIFVFDVDPHEAARQHCDRHVVKMILEAAQMLSTTYHVCGDAPSIAYRPTHKNHPCTVWARTSTTNYRWLVDYGLALCKLYTLRYHRVHKSEAVIVALVPPPSCVPIGGLTPFAQAMPDQYRDSDAALAYQRYFIAEKSHIATWHDGPPYWWPEDV